MIVREPIHSKDVRGYDTQRLREEFLIQDLFIPGEIKRVYSHIDRIIVMGYCPDIKDQELGEGLDIMTALGTDYFLERRELGIINVGGSGSLVVDGKQYKMKTEDGIYIGKETKEVIFKSDSKDNPAKYYTLSVPAHKVCKTVHIDIDKTKQVALGSESSANKRIIYQFIHPDVVETCQLAMGLTKMAENNVWNTMPCHTHERRMEVYFYFNLPEMVFHFMGRPEETRHLVVRNEEAVISPSWSIHSGCATSSYNFIWGMCGENQTFTDMDQVEMKYLK